MLEISFGTQNTIIGKITVVNHGRYKTGKTKYFVKIDMLSDKENILIPEFYVMHRREDGVFKLLKIVSAKLNKEIDKFFDIPNEKIVDIGQGCFGIRRQDIPERFSKALFKGLGVCTCPVIDGDGGVYLHDIQDWIKQQKSGIQMPFD